MSTKKRQTSCRQCGECCRNGGAALHSEDIALLREGGILRRDLITIRKGEFAHNPVLGEVGATREEIVKLRGSAGEWTCCYYDPLARGCTIYGKRPVACGTLKCWDPAESLKLVGNDLLSRSTILAGDEILLGLIAEYEEYCPLPDLGSLAAQLAREARGTILLLDKAVNRDLGFRNRIVAGADAVAAQEMFLFGRPLFQLLQPFGLEGVATGLGLHLLLRNKGAAS